MHSVWKVGCSLQPVVYLVIKPFVFFCEKNIQANFNFNKYIHHYELFQRWDSFGALSASYSFHPVFHHSSVIPDVNWSHGNSVSILDRGCKTFIKKSRKIKNIPRRRGAHMECETGYLSIPVEAAMNINNHSEKIRRFPSKLLLIESWVFTKLFY